MLCAKEALNPIRFKTIRSNWEKAVPIYPAPLRGNEFLAAYNAGTISYALQMSLDDITHTFDGKPSPNWYTLSANDLQFIKKTVQQHRPKDWARIKGRLFFNQTSGPFFK